MQLIIPLYMPKYPLFKVFTPAKDNAGLEQIGVWHLQTADYKFVSQWFLIRAFSYESLGHFRAKKIIIIILGSSRRQKPELALDFYVWPLWNSSNRLQATDTDVIGYFPALSCSLQRSCRPALLWRPIPGEVFTFLKVIVVEFWHLADQWMPKPLQVSSAKQKFP